MCTDQIGKELYWDNQNTLLEFPSKILAVDDQWIQIAPSYFYPEGGGQPGDTGYLQLQNTQIRIIDAQTRDTGDTWLLSEAKTDIHIGQKVYAKIDKKRRQQLTKNHSAQHLISAIFWNRFEASTTHSNIAEDEFEIDISKSLSIEDIKSVVKAATEYITNDVKFTSIVLSNEEYIQRNIRGKGIKPKPGQLIRLVAIEPGIDANLCGGTHVASAKEITAIAVKRVEGKRLRFVAGDSALYLTIDQQFLLMEILREFKTNEKNLLSEILNLQTSLTTLQRAQNHLQIDLLQEKISATQWFTAGNLQIKLLEQISGDRSTASNLQLELKEHQVVVVRFESNIVVIRGGSDESSARVMAVFRKFGVKGGGKGSFLMGKYVGSDSLQHLLNQLE